MHASAPVGQAGPDFRGGIHDPLTGVVTCGGFATIIPTVCAFQFLKLCHLKLDRKFAVLEKYAAAGKCGSSTKLIPLEQGRQFSQDFMG